MIDRARLFRRPSTMTSLRQEEVAMAAEDDSEAFDTPEADSTGAHESDGHERDDDELVRSAAHTIAQSRPHQALPA